MWRISCPLGTRGQVGRCCGFAGGCLGRWAAPDVRALGCFGLVAVVARVLEGGSRLTLGRLSLGRRRVRGKRSAKTEAKHLEAMAQ